MRKGQEKLLNGTDKATAGKFTPIGAEFITGK